MHWKTLDAYVYIGMTLDNKSGRMWISTRAAVASHKRTSNARPLRLLIMLSQDDIVSLDILSGLPYNDGQKYDIPKEDFIMEDKELLQEEEQTNILTLTDENGVDTDFEYLDCIEYEGKEYLVLMPAEELATEIVILEVEPVDEENENYISVSDEAVLNAVYDIFKDRYKDILTFED